MVAIPFFLMRLGGLFASQAKVKRMRKYMANIRIVTNNPMAHKKYPHVCEFLEFPVSGIFQAARDKIHLGAVLINHPLAGSIKPNESPYKSLVLSCRVGDTDPDSLSLIEGAVDVLRKMPEKNRQYTPKILEDFMVIDLDLLQSAIKALPANYYL